MLSLGVRSPCIYYTCTKSKTHSTHFVCQSISIVFIVLLGMHNFVQIETVSPPKGASFRDDCRLLNPLQLNISPTYKLIHEKLPTLNICTHICIWGNFCLFLCQFSTQCNWTIIKWWVVKKRIYPLFSPKYVPSNVTCTYVHNVLFTVVVKTKVLYPKY